MSAVTAVTGRRAGAAVEAAGADAAAGAYAAGADAAASAGAVTTALAEVIRRHPNCLLIVNGRSWRVERGDPSPAGFERWPREAVDLWYRAQTLCRSEEFAGDGEGFGHCMGLDLLKALAVLQGVRVESV